MFEYFYNEIFRKTIISFGTLFNNITVKQEGSVVKVPLAYGPIQKFLARLEQAPNLNQSVAISLPRMSFEFIGITYDPSRKVTTTQQFTVKDPDDGTETKKVFMPVPYNMQFELAIMCKLNDDALQIVEQILPYFQPQYNLTVQRHTYLVLLLLLPRISSSKFLFVILLVDPRVQKEISHTLLNQEQLRITLMMLLPIFQRISLQRL